MRVNLTDFENGMPLFELKDLNDVASFVGMCLVEAVKQGNFESSDWDKYIERWCDNSCMPTEVYRHLSIVLSNNLSVLKSLK